MPEDNPEKVEVEDEGELEPEMEFDKYDKLGAYHWVGISNDIKKHNLHSYQQYKLITQSVTPGRVLDVGCGDGALSHFLAKKGCEVHGIDTSETAIAYAKSKTSKIEYPHKPKFYIDSVYTFNSKIKFDIIILCDVIEHLQEPDKAIEALKKLLNINGKIIITTPKAQKSGKKIDKYHFKEYTKTDFESFLKKHFSEVMVVGVISKWLLDFYKKCGYNNILVYFKWFVNYLSIKGYNFGKKYSNNTPSEKYTNLVAICKGSL